MSDVSEPFQPDWQNFIIGYACLSFRHISDIVTISPEAGDDAGIAVLIGKIIGGMMSLFLIILIPMRPLRDFFDRKQSL